MGRIYEAIRKDIEKLRKIDEAINNKQLVSMDDVYDTCLALEKIQYVITYTESEVPDLLKTEGRFPLGELTNFNIPEDFETIVNNWEESLGDNRVEHALDHLHKQDQIERYVPEITPHNPQAYYEYVRGTVDNIARISQTGHFGISRDGVVAMATSAQQDLVKTIYAQDYAFNVNEKGNQPIYEFIDNPIGEIIEWHRDDLMFDGDQTVREFLREHEQYYANVLNNSEHHRPFQEVQDYYPVANALTPIHTSKWNPKGLSEAIKQSVETYAANYKGKRGEMNVGAFLSIARDRIEDAIFDHAMQLGDDQDSKFVKDFLANPVQTMENHFNETKKDIANKIHGQEENYNQARANKVDRFAQIETRKKERFEAMFGENNANFNPATFKHDYQGSTFERFLGRTSPEWTALSDHIDSWKNIGAERNYDRATELASNYLRHKFPNLDPKEVTPEMCRGLRGAGKDRSLFCLTLVHGKDIAEDEVNQEIYEQANRRFDQLESRLHPHGENFQDKLANDIKEEHDVNNDNEINNDNLIIQNDMKM